jgi:hypothetical protein
MSQNKILIAAAFIFSTHIFAQCNAAHCSAVIPATPATASISRANLGNTPMRLEVRLHGQNWQAATSVNPVLNFGGLNLSYLGGSGLPHKLFYGVPDTAGTGNCLIDITGATDILVRVSRDVTASIARLEAFNTLTGVPYGSACDVPITAFASGIAIQALGIGVGNSNATGYLAFMRAYSSVVPEGTRIPIAGTNGDLGDWEFENSQSDSSGSHQNFTGVNTYVNTPTYNPACNAGPQQTIPLGNTITLNGSGSFPLDGGTALSYAWSYFSGSDGVNQNPIIPNPAAATATVSGLNTFGSANFQLVVTDSSNQSSACTVHDGVVPMNGSGVVNLLSEGRTAAQIAMVGPLIGYGQNPWPWADTAAMIELNLQTANLTNYYTPYWRTFKAGTIAFTAGSATVTGTGTNFQVDFCGGAGMTTPISGAVLIWKYTGTDSLTHYTQQNVSSCTDATHLVLTQVYPGSPKAPWPSASSGSGASYGEADLVSGQYSTWLYITAPGNYYDNVEFFATSYWRSGFDTFYSAYQTLATYWLEWPFLDQFYNCGDFNNNVNPNGSACFAETRSYSVTGIVLYEQDGHPSVLGGLRAGVWTHDAYEMYLIGTQGGMADIRDDAYALSFESQCGLIDSGYTFPSSLPFFGGSSCQAFVKATLANAYTPYRRADLGNGWGTWYGYQGSGTSIVSQAGAGSVSITNGSATVTGTGTNWTSALNGAFWVFNAPAGTQPRTNAGGDNTSYQATVTSATTLTLDRPYQGTTRSGAGFQFGSAGLVGWGIQPFMEGHLGLAFHYASLAMAGYDAPSAATYASYRDSLVAWEFSYGYNPTAGGLYNGTLFPGCATFPLSSSGPVAGCYPVGVTQSQARTLSLDIMRFLADSYAATPQPATLTLGNLLMSQMFSKPGTAGPNPDGFYLSDLDVGGTFVTGTPPLGSAPKWAGELCGYMAACSAWPAATLSLSQPIGTAVRGSGSISGNGNVR